MGEGRNAREVRDGGKMEDVAGRIFKVRIGRVWL